MTDCGCQTHDIGTVANARAVFTRLCPAHQAISDVEAIATPPVGDAAGRRAGPEFHYYRDGTDGKVT